MNQLQAAPLNEGLRCKKRLWRERGEQPLLSKSGYSSTLRPDGPSYRKIIGLLNELYPLPRT